MVNYMFDRNKGNKPDSEETQAPVSTASDMRSAGSSAPGVKPAGASSGARAAIGSTIRIKGDISGDENLLIEGRVEGTVTLAAHELIIGKTGNVSADLTAKVIRVDGEVQGDITGKEKVFLSSTSNTKGNIVTPKMTLEEGARFKGSIDIDPAHANSTASPRPVAVDSKPIESKSTDSKPAGSAGGKSS